MQSSSCSRLVLDPVAGYRAPLCASASGTVASSVDTALTAARDHDRCLYKSKACTNPRAVKLNGELHLLCSYHRKRANLNQQRVHQRRKIRVKQCCTGLDASECWELLEPYSSPCGDLTAHELKILEILLFFSNSPPHSNSDSAR